MLLLYIHHNNKASDTFYIDSCTLYCCQVRMSNLRTINICRWYIVSLATWLFWPLNVNDKFLWAHGDAGWSHKSSMIDSHLECKHICLASRREVRESSTSCIYIALPCISVSIKELSWSCLIYKQNLWEFQYSFNSRFFDFQHKKTESRNGGKFKPYDVLAACSHLQLQCNLLQSL